MTRTQEREQKLEIILKTAIANGFDLLHFRNLCDHSAKLLIGDGYSILGLLLSHDFAKAIYFGVERRVKGKGFAGEGWMCFLSKAVIQEDILEYYYQYVKTLKI